MIVARVMCQIWLSKHVVANMKQASILVCSSLFFVGRDIHSMLHLLWFLKSENPSSMSICLLVLSFVRELASYENMQSNVLGPCCIKKIPCQRILTQI